MVPVTLNAAYQGFPCLSPSLYESLTTVPGAVDERVSGRSRWAVMRGGVVSKTFEINPDAMVKASFIVRGVYQGEFSSVFIRDDGSAPGRGLEHGRVDQGCCENRASDYYVFSLTNVSQNADISQR